MKAKKQPPTHAQDSPARELPIEAFARLVEGLDADDIESACARDGAKPGGAPPGWSDPKAFTRYLASRRVDLAAGAAEGSSNVPSSMNALLEEFTLAPDGLLVARRVGESEKGASDSAVLEILSRPPGEGDWVAVDIPGVGKLLRKLRFIGGVALLCDPSGEKLAIPVEEAHMPLLWGVKLACTQQ